MKTQSVSMAISSTAFAAGQPIPGKHTGEGADISPPLSWPDPPENAKELALIVDDPDAPTVEPWVHWLVYKIPPGTKNLPEGIENSPALAHPAGAMQGRNTSGKIGYSGPFPPKGHGVHHYHFRLYALDTPLELAPGVDKATLLHAMENHILAEGELVGTYERR